MTRSLVERPDLPPCARFGRRAAAILIDIVVFTVLCGIVAVPAASRLRALREQPTAEYLATVIWTPELLRMALLTAGGWAVLWFTYLVLGWGVLGATPGKWLLGLRVIDWRGRYPIGPVRAVLRLTAYNVSALPLGAGHLLSLLRSDRRTLHDMLAGTRVIRARQLPQVREVSPQSAHRRHGSNPPR